MIYTSTTIDFTWYTDSHGIFMATWGDAPIDEAQLVGLKKTNSTLELGNNDEFTLNFGSPWPPITLQYEDDPTHPFSLIDSPSPPTWIQNGNTFSYENAWFGADATTDGIILVGTIDFGGEGPDNA